VTFGCWVYATVASRVRIGISDGVGSAQSSYHSGGSSWEYLEVSLDLDAAATRLRLEHQVNTGNTAGYFDGGVACEGDDTTTDLSDGSQFFISKIPASRDIRISEYDPSRRHGIIIGKPLYDKTKLKMTGQVIGADAEAARTNLDTVLQVLLGINTMRRDNNLRDMYLFSDRFMRGVPMNWSDDGAMAIRRLINFDFDFTVPEPFSRFINWSRHVETISSSPDAFDLTAGGNVFTKPVIYVIADQGGAVDDCTLENLTTGESVSYLGTIASGDTLVIDCLAETVENDGADDLANHTGDFLHLLSGLNKMKFTGDACTLKIDWVKRWI